MAIPFLNNITLNNNEIQNVRLQNATSPPLNFGPGQIYFDSTQSPTIVDTAKYYANSTDTWVSLKEYSFPAVAQADGYITSTITGTTAKPIVKFNLNATGTADSTTYLRGDNQWQPISAIPGTYKFTLSDNAPSPGPVSGIVAENDTVTIAANSDLTSNLTGQASTSKTLTIGLKVDGGVGVSDNYVVNQAVAVADADDSIPFNQNTDYGNPSLDTDIVKKTTFGTIPVNALSLVKQYIDDSVAGGLVYQGGYDASTDTTSPGGYGLQTPPNPNIIKKGWTYTVTADGTFFTTEQLRVGDVLIAEVDAPTVLDDWTTVQNNVDLASLTQVGIGNVNSSTGQEELGISVSYSSGTAAVGLNIDGLSAVTTTEDDSSVAIHDNANGVNKKIELGDLAPVLNSFISFSGTIGDGSATSIDLQDSGAVAPNINHGLGEDSSSFMIQLVDTSSGETVYADVTRGASGLVTIDFASAPAANGIRVLIQKIG
jgi:hypothetical protein